MTTRLGLVRRNWQPLVTVLALVFGIGGILCRSLVSSIVDRLAGEEAAYLATRLTVAVSAMITLLGFAAVLTIVGHALFGRLGLSSPNVSDDATQEVTLSDAGSVTREVVCTECFVKFRGVPPKHLFPTYQCPQCTKEVHYPGPLLVVVTFGITSLFFLTQAARGEGNVIHYLLFAIGGALYVARDLSRRVRVWRALDQSGAVGETPRDREPRT